MAYLNPATRTRDRVGPEWVVRFSPMRRASVPPGGGGMGGTPFDVPAPTPNYSMRRGDTLAVRFTLLGDLTNWIRAWYTAKAAYGDTDLESEIQVTIDTGGAGGLIRLNGAATTAAWGLLEVDVAEAAITLRLSSDATGPHDVWKRLLYDVQVETDTSIRTTISGYVDIIPDVTLVL